MAAVSHLGAFEVTLGGEVLSCLPLSGNPAADPAPAGVEPPAGYEGTYEAQENTRGLEDNDTPVIVGGSLRRGMGFIRKRHDDEDGSQGYAWGEDFEGRFDDGGRPAGRRQTLSFSGLSDGGTATANCRVFHMAEFDGHLWLSCTSGSNRAVIIRVPNGDPTQTPVYDPALNAFASAGDSLHSGYHSREFIAFEDNAGVSSLYLGAYSSGAVQARIYERPTGGAWASATLTNSVDNFATVWWEDETGVGSDRLIVRSSASHQIRVLTKGSDPMLSASYTTPISIGSASSQIQRLIAAPQRVLVLKTDGLYDVTPFRAPNLTPHVSEAVALNNHAATLVGRVPGYLYDDHVYYGRGLGVGRYDLRTDGAQQRINGECAPWAFAHDGFPIRGWPTAFAEDNGWLLLGIFNPDNNCSYVVAGKDRRTLGIDVPNPLVWHGALAGPISGKMITWLHAGAVYSSSGTTLASLKRYLWLGLLSTGGVMSIDYQELPRGGGPLSLAISGGSFAHNPSSVLYHTGQTWDDANALKAVRRYDHQGSKLSASNFITLAMRADGDPASTSGYTTEGTIDADSENIVPTTVKSGRFIQTKLTWTTASSYTTAGVSHELRARAAVRRETFEVRTLDVILERDHELVNGAPDVRSPDTTFDTIMAFRNTAQQAFIDQQGRTYQVLVSQRVSFWRAEIDDGQWRTVCRLKLSVVSGPT